MVKYIRGHVCHILSGTSKILVGLCIGLVLGGAFVFYIFGPTTRMPDDSESLVTRISEELGELSDRYEELVEEYSWVEEEK